MTRLGVAIDLGTSGFRAQAIELDSGEVLSTAITTRHPLPGANVIDHVHFSLDMGVETARRIMTRAINRLLAELRVPTTRTESLAVCGNPIQLSIFQGMEIRDLAYAGKRMLQRIGVAQPKRDAAVVKARALPGLELPGDCQIIIPPAVRHEVGADALALVIRTGMLEHEESSVAIDYGTNAEIILSHQGRVLCGSTAAGPALEGQQLSHGMLAAPGAISDLNGEGELHRLAILDDHMLPTPGPLVDLRRGVPGQTGDRPRALGITGTGVIAAVEQGMKAGLVFPPRIETPDGALHFVEDITLTSEDLVEAGKAFGAVRAGLITLCREADMGMEEIQTAYMAGASGTYVDARKARWLGLLPPRVRRVHQVGNTSLAMARELLTNPRALDEMSSLARRLRDAHCMFAASKTFSKVFLLEFSHWTEGMPMSLYRRFLAKYGLPDLPPIDGEVEVSRHVKHDIGFLGNMGLTAVHDIGDVAHVSLEGCSFCGACVAACPEKALTMDTQADQPALVLDQARCDGVACRRCERACPDKVFRLELFFGLAKKAPN